jgi:hypothetical protein
MRQAATHRSIARALIARLDDAVLADLRSEDPATAIEVHFAPIGLRSLPEADALNDRCSIAGYYESEFDPEKPWIIYADDLPVRRVRFTLLHELAHHLLATTACDLLDEIDRLGGSLADGAVRVEELVCHAFAGAVLIPDEVLDAVIGSAPLMPQHLVDIAARTHASYDAIAVQVTERMEQAGAVALVRQPGQVSFAPASPRMTTYWWPANSEVDPAGPLARALATEQQPSRPETYRWQQAYARTLHCETLRVRPGLAVGVMSEKPRTGGLSLLEQPDPIYKDRDLFCAWDGSELDTGWCDGCAGPLCGECGRCRCTKPLRNPLCPECGLEKPFRRGATKCLDCEADE